MEQEFETPHPDYIKGFNAGYVMAKQEPELADKLVKGLGESEYAKGFEKGYDQLQYEKLRENMPHWMRSDVDFETQNQREASKEKNIEKEGDEPERD